MSYQMDLGADWLKKVTEQGKALVPKTQPSTAGSNKGSISNMVLNPPAPLRIAGAAAAAYHGYRRNQSILWSLVWAFFGGGRPVITNAIAAAQGFGKQKKG